MGHVSLRYCVVTVLSLLVMEAGLSQLETPQPSPRGRIEQRVGVMDVAISYSRPGVKGRKIFGDLVPYGEEWRTGANSPTTMTFSDSVKLGGSSLPAGTYSLYTIPGENEWTIIFNRDATGGPPRDPKQDALNFKVKPSVAAQPVETFTINIADVSNNAANVELAWERTVVRFPMEFDVDSKVMAAIKKSMENPYAGVAGMYYQSASYYFTSNRDLKTALDWVNKSLDMNKNPYWVWRLKSQIQAGLKDYKGAIASAEMSKERAKAAGNDQFVRINDEAIAGWKMMK